jgi:RHS repeat-associated protein
MHRDHLNSIRVVTDTSAAVVQRSNYRPSGERLQSVALVPETKGYIGERHDDESGLIYLHARYYDPVLGRFLQADTLDPTVPGVGVNRYAYAGNSPVMASDPSGHNYGLAISPRLAAAFGVALGFAAADGPLPVGDVIGAVIAIGAMITEPSEIGNEDAGAMESRGLPGDWGATDDWGGKKGAHSIGDESEKHVGVWPGDNGEIVVGPWR